MSIMDDHVPAPADRSITRQQLEAVIRRAIELYTARADAEERVSEEEVLRIGAELGLPADLVRQAIYEAPAVLDPSLAHRFVGPATVSVVRALPLADQEAAARLEEYLSTREYLILRRRQQSVAYFEPAEDTISKMARALSRPARNWYLARARGVALAVRPLEQGRSHVRIDMDLGNRRREAVANGLVGGGLLGLALGGAGAVAASLGLADTLGTTFATVAAAFAGIAGLGGGLSAGLAAAAAGYRRRLAAARVEVEGLLDRLERGERLEPPPAPWRRLLRSPAQAPYRR
ncbi:MAG TPA: hypothetical protein VF192_11310 [Longimicrobiales bacterium]